jgi:DNA-binding MarR family transcriptional regulator
VLYNLEHREIVERYRSDIDRRVVYTRLTARGVALVSHAPRVFGGDFARRFASLSERRRRELVESVDVLARLMSTGE